MKKTITLCFILFAFALTFSQKTLSGKVTGDDGKPIASASVTVEEIGKNTILSYGITDAKGNYKITYNSDDPKILVKVKAFNRKTQANEYSNASQNIDFTVEEKVTEIKEVKLKTKLITKRGDTISYDLKSFENKADRTLSDVLKKIPGIEVNKDGSILYQGEPINKFYVNGKDLMEGSYGLINNSLPKDAVQKVEVMENHQPVKILQDKLASENAAINVKLKSAITVTGRGEVSSGFTEPWLWNVKLSPMLFTSKVQWVLNYKTNNLGEEVEKENNIMAFGNRFEGVRRNFSSNSWLSVENAALPQNVPVKRYLFNNVHNFSANLLTNLSKDWEFKANSSYTNNAINRESTVTRYNQQGQLINISSVDNNFYTNQAKGEIIFSKNAKKGFFKNTTTFNGLWNTDTANTYNSTNTASNSNQRFTTPSNNFQNSLSAIIPWKEKLVNTLSFISIRDDRQDLYINPAAYVPALSSQIVNSDRIHQALRLKTLEANHSASVGFSKKSWTLSPEIGLNYTHNQLHTDLNGERAGGIENPGLAYENHVNFRSFTPYTQMVINYKKESFEANLTLPANFNNIRAEEPGRLSRSLSVVTLEPRFFMRYDLSSFWKISSFGSISNSFGNVNDMFAGRILFSARNLSTKDTDIQQTTSRSVGSRLEYRNPLNNIFFNVNYNIASRSNNIIYNNIISSNQQITIRGYNLDNSLQSNNLRTELGKYFPKLKTNLSFGYNFSDTQYQQLVNYLSSNAPTPNDLTEINTQNQSYSIKVNNNYFSWISVDYSASWTGSENKTFNNTIKGFNHALGVFLYPIKNHTIGFTWDELHTKNQANSFKNAFYDLSYQFSLEKSKIDFEFKVLNLANTNLFQNVSFDGLNNQTVYTNINIRPRQYFFTIKFNFK